MRNNESKLQSDFVLTRIFDETKGKTTEILALLRDRERMHHIFNEVNKDIDRKYLEYLTLNPSDHFASKDEVCGWIVRDLEICLEKSIRV